MTVGELKAALAPLDDALGVFVQQTATGCNLVVPLFNLVATIPALPPGSIVQVPPGSLSVT